MLGVHSQSSGSFFSANVDLVFRLEEFLILLDTFVFQEVLIDKAPLFGLPSDFHLVLPVGVLEEEALVAELACSWRFGELEVADVSDIGLLEISGLDWPHHRVDLVQFGARWDVVHHAVQLAHDFGAGISLVNSLCRLVAHRERRNDLRFALAALVVAGDLRNTSHGWDVSRASFAEDLVQHEGLNSSLVKATRQGVHVVAFAPIEPVLRLLRFDLVRTEHVARSGAVSQKLESDVWNVLQFWRDSIGETSDDVFGVALLEATSEAELSRVGVPDELSFGRVTDGVDAFDDAFWYLVGNLVADKSEVHTAEPGWEGGLAEVYLTLTWGRRTISGDLSPKIAHFLGCRLGFVVWKPVTSVERTSKDNSTGNGQ